MTKARSFILRLEHAAGRRKIKPRLRRAALAQATTIFPGTPWTGGIDINPHPFDGDLARVVADKLHAQVLSVNYPDITDKLIKASHQRGLTIIPWTVDAPADMAAAIDRGLDGLITDYPDKARDVMDAKGLDLPEQFESPFDIEGHRGARAYRPENTLSAYAYGLDHGVDTLEMDIGVTKDGVPVMSHNRQVNGVHCHDTAPVTPGDPLFRYAGKSSRTSRWPRSRRSTAASPIRASPSRSASPARRCRPCRRSSTSWPRAATRTCASTSRRRSARWSTTRSPMT